MFLNGWPSGMISVPIHEEKKSKRADRWVTGVHLFHIFIVAQHLQGFANLALDRVFEAAEGLLHPGMPGAERKEWYNKNHQLGVQQHIYNMYVYVP